MRHRALVILVVLALTGVAPGVVAQAPVSARELTIGFVADGPSERSYLPLALLESEITALLGREFAVRFPAAKRVHGDWQVAGIEAALSASLADPDVDVIITSGLIATHLAAHFEDLAEPVIGMAVADATLQKFPQQGESSGKKNFVYLADDRTVGADLELFHRLVGYHHLAILADRAIFDALPQLPRLAAAAEQRLGVRMTLIEVNDNADAAMAALPADADAVFVPPLLRFSQLELERLGSALMARRLPSFALLSQPYIDAGLLMTGAGRQLDLNRAARRIALNLQSILLGHDAGTLKVRLSQPQKLAINMATAAAIGYSPRWEDLEGAILVNDEVVERGPVLSLLDALERALEANLALKLAEFGPLLAATDVEQARAGLLPQLGLNVAGTAIDADRANPLLQPERSAGAELRASQLLYSERVWAGYRIARYLHEAADQRLRRAVLDTIERAASAYLVLLQARAQAAVRRSNVAVTETNLELAMARARIGQSGRTDVLRFTSELAIDRQSFYAAGADADAALVELKRVLNLPQAERVVVSDDGIPGLVELLGDARFQRFFDNRQRWNVLRRYALERALANAPELAENSALLAGAERNLQATGRAYYVPDVNLVGQSATRLLRGGRGASLLGTGRDDDEWALGLEATLPLFLGGARGAERARARYELTRTRVQDAELTANISARVLTALERAGGSYPAIRLAGEASAAARDNLALVTDAYSAGAASITDLNDAQDAALTARLAAAQARYRFMLDFVAVQRGMADFDVLLLAEGLNAWYEAVDAYFRAAENSAR